MNGTVKQFKDILEEMRNVYPFKDEKTFLSTHGILSQGNNALEIHTEDEKTGVTIVMSKRLPEIRF